MTQPPFLPTLLTDETIYSWCATAYVMSGWRTAEGWSRHLLGAAHGIRQHDFPTYLPAVLSSHLTDISAEQALRQHSLVGMFWPFIPSAFSERLLGESPESRTTWRCHAQLVRRVMLCQSRTLSWESPLRYCPGCIVTDRNTVGRAYWHVGHQWPVSRHCVKHGIRLITTQTAFKTWKLPDMDVTTAGQEDDDSCRVSLVVQQLAQALCSLDSIDLSLLRQSTLLRLRALGVIHSIHAVRHARLNEWYREQPISRWCSFARGGMEQFASSDWLPKLLWRRTQDHPIRWIIAWASLDWPTAEIAVQALQDSQRGECIGEGGQFALFKPADLAGTSRLTHPSPAAFEQALEQETSYAGVMARLGVSRGDVVRWLAASPEVWDIWRRRLQRLRIEGAEAEIRQHIKQCPGTTRQELAEAVGSALRLMRRHVPGRLEQILAAVPSRVDLQRKLFYDL